MSTSRRLIKAFPFSLLYTWTLVASSSEKLPLCCTGVEALLRATITSTRPSGPIFISSHVTICSVVWVPAQWVAEFCVHQNSDHNIRNTKRGWESKTGTIRDAHSLSLEETRKEEEETVSSLASLLKSREEEEFPVQSVQRHISCG